MSFGFPEDVATGGIGRRAGTGFGLSPHQNIPVGHQERAGWGTFLCHARATSSWRGRAHEGKLATKGVISVKACHEGGHSRRRSITASVWES